MVPSDATWAAKRWEYYIDTRTDSEVESDDEEEEPGSSFNNPIDLTLDESDDDEV